MKSHMGQSSSGYSSSCVWVSLEGWNHLGAHFSFRLSLSCRLQNFDEPMGS